MNKTAIFWTWLICVCLSGPIFGQASLTPRLQQALQQNPPSGTIRVGALLETQCPVSEISEIFYENKRDLQTRSSFIIPLLQDWASNSQRALLQELRQHPGVKPNSIQPLWITNIVFFEATPAAILDLSARKDIKLLDLDAQLLLDGPVSYAGSSDKIALAGGREPGLDAIGAPKYWKMGYTGYGSLVAGFDTGVEPDHPALRRKWKGNIAPATESWFEDSIPGALPRDCDPATHGTHTMGIMCGLDPVTRDTIGVAFNANWMGSPSLCGSGSSMSRHLAAFQWAVDPDGNPGTIHDQPDVICNAWFDPTATNECNGPYRLTFDAVEAIGIAIVFSAGNSGPADTTVTPPKNINSSLTNVFCVASVSNTSGYPIDFFSSRGPSRCGGTGSLLIKPEVAAPGSNIRSCTGRNGYSRYTGTSMAAPHVAGAIALLREAFPTPTGTQLKEALYFSAIDLGAPGEDNAYGRGLINLKAAHDTLLAWGFAPVTFANDASSQDILGIEPLNCQSTLQPQISLHNPGHDTLFSCTVHYEIPGVISDSISWTGMLAPGMMDTLLLPSVTVPFGDHRFIAQTSSPNGTADDRPQNDGYDLNFTIQEQLSIPGDTLNCRGSVTLTAPTPQSNAFIKWFPSSTFGQELGTGNTFTTPILNQTTSYFVDLVDSFRVGPRNNSIGAGGVVNFSQAYLTVEAWESFTLRQVTVYADSAGPLTVSLRNGTALIAEKSFQLIPGANILDLNFPFFPGNNYRIGTNGPANIFRNSDGASYPYFPANSMMAITGCSGSDPDAYFYFYHWLLEKGNPCGRARVEVVVEDGIVAGAVANPSLVDLSQGGQVQFFSTSSGAVSWFWEFGDGATGSGDNPQHTYSNVGTYIVTHIVCNALNCCDTTTTQVVVTDPTGLSEDLWAQISIYPNPANGWVNIEIPNQVSSLKISVFNALGQQIQLQNHELVAGKNQLNLSHLATGIWFIHLQSEDRSQVFPLLLSR